MADPHAESSCVCHLVARGGCQQGRSCPIREIEMACDAALDPRTDFPAPKGKPMQNYRLSSSAYTGRAPRSMRDAFGCHPNDPVHPMPDGRVAVFDAIGRAAKALGRFIARVFGR